MSPQFSIMGYSNHATWCSRFNGRRTVDLRRPRAGHGRRMHADLPVGATALAAATPHRRAGGRVLPAGRRGGHWPQLRPRDVSDQPGHDRSRNPPADRRQPARLYGVGGPHRARRHRRPRRFGPRSAHPRSGGAGRRGLGRGAPGRFDQCSSAGKLGWLG